MLHHFGGRGQIQHHAGLPVEDSKYVGRGLIGRLVQDEDQARLCPPYERNRILPRGLSGLRLACDDERNGAGLEI